LERCGVDGTEVDWSWGGEEARLERQARSDEEEVV